MIDPCYPYPLSSRRVKGVRPLRFPKAAPLVGFGAKTQREQVKSLTWVSKQTESMGVWVDLL